MYCIGVVSVCEDSEIYSKHFPNLQQILKLEFLVLVLVFS